MGNIRINYTFDTSTLPGSLKILEENHYYPFGLKHTESYTRKDIVFEKKEDDEWEKKVSAPPPLHLIPLNEIVPNSGYQYKYNGKEWQDELGLNMYGMDMRMYDPAIARWGVKDPVVHYDFSPYNAFDNNPVFWADPSGADSQTDMFGRSRFDRWGIYIPPSERTQASASNGGNENGGDNDNGYKDKNKKKEKTKNNLRSSASDPLDGYDGYTHQGDDSSPPISEVSDEEMSRRNNLMVNAWLIPLHASGLTSLYHFGSRFFIKKTVTKNPYLGVKLASKFLKNEGVSRQSRLSILQSFQLETISLQTAGNSTFGLRFFGGTSSEFGKYLFPSFSNLSTRSGLALPYSWGNTMSSVSQFQITPGTQFIFGRAASQGGSFSGGSLQIYVNDLSKLIKSGF